MKGVVMCSAIIGLATSLALVYGCIILTDDIHKHKAGEACQDDILLEGVWQR